MCRTSARAEVVTSQHVRGTPDIIIEIALPGTRKRDETIKQQLYKRAGVVGILDCRSRNGRGPYLPANDGGFSIARSNSRARQVTCSQHHCCPGWNPAVDAIPSQLTASMCETSRLGAGYGLRARRHAGAEAPALRLTSITVA